MKYVFLHLSFWCLIGFNLIFSQNSIHNYDKYIDNTDLFIHLSYLASDKLEGRNTGEPGQKLAAEYLSNQFKKMGATPAPGFDSYYQSFRLYKKEKSGTIQVGTKKLSYPADFGFQSFYQPITDSIQSTVYFSSIEEAKEKMKVMKLAFTTMVIEVKDTKEVDVTEWKDISARGVIFIVENYDARLFTTYATSGLAYPEKNPNLPILFINKKSLGKKKWNKLSKSGVSVQLNSNAKAVVTENVVGFLEGTHDELKNEVIVISAHYDHIGIEKGEIYNGADDNGSGTSALIELGQAFAEAKKSGVGLSRSILLIAMTGEEMGLLGSRYYSENPMIPLEKTVIDLNIDMIGRTGEGETNPFSVFIIGSNLLSEDLHTANESANEQFTQLKLDYLYNDVNHPMRLYYRSDHYNFAKHGIPSIFYFGGFHPDYHKPTDDLDKINFDKINAVTKLVFHTAVLVGNNPERPVLLEK